jgi:hypothetical protein
MGCYSFDTIFRVLGLEAPTYAEAETSERHDETYPRASTVHLDFPARGEMPPVRVTWYDGGRKPRPDAVPSGTKLDDEGLLFVGDKGSILCGFNGNNPRALPEAKKTDSPAPTRTGRRRAGGNASVRQWLDACRDLKTKPGANFEFSGLVTEALQLGNIAVRTGERLTWDRANLKVTNLAAAERFIRPERRAGWEL